MARILLVEDNEMNRDMLSRRLQKRGYEVLLANDGREGVDSASSHLPDLILMDVQMPVMNGLEAAGIICGKYPRNKRPVIVALTANATEEDRKTCMAVGMDGYISKPITLEKLAESIRKVRQKIMERTS